MRMRHKPYARPELAAWPFFIDEPAAQRGKWHGAFADPAKPLRLELGCGKGGFLAKAALRDSGYNHLGFDIKSEVLVVAKRTIQQQFEAAGRDIDNVLIASQEIALIRNTLAPQDSVQRIYINFCNPWYKSGHAKHRLTHPRQLAQYREFLEEEGEIWFKTDDLPLFEDSLRYFEYTGFEIVWMQQNLHNFEPEWNIRTEHEAMFAAQGLPIKACIARKRPAELNYEEISRLKDI